MRCARFRKLENVLKETLRLHPPLIILMRVAQGEFEVEGYPIHNGDFVAASPAISNRIPEDFPESRTTSCRTATRSHGRRTCVNRWTWIPFGAGRHRCVGAAFATDADQGDLLGAVARVRVRDGATGRELPQRPLQDGGAAGPAGEGALPASKQKTEGDDGLPSRGRPGFVPGPRDVRTRGARLLPGAQAGQGRDPRLRAARRGPRGDRAGRRWPAPPKHYPSKQKED